MIPADNQEYGPRLQRLTRFLERDPGNLSLLADAAAAAFDERAFDLAGELIDRHARLAELSPPLANLQGLTAMARQRFDEAADAFGRLRAQGHDDPAIRFNLAWAKAMTGRFDEALPLLDDEAIAATPRGPALKIQAMHHLELYEDALTVGHGLAERYPDNQALLGALATLAMDAEQVDLARHYAERAGDDPEALAALGMLILGDHDAAGSLDLFDHAIAQDQRNPRAWVGKGLGLLASGDAAAAAEAIDRGAELFEDHLGSWIASGWAHVVNGAYDKARASFERALAIDPNFAESHGGLAVLEIVAGNAESAKRHCDIALRLDRQSLGGALAKTLLLDAAGDAGAAQRIRDVVLSRPIGPQRQTIAQALIGFGGAPRR